MVVHGLREFLFDEGAGAKGRADEGRSFQGGGVFGVVEVMGACFFCHAY
jgi:hypothetical protein